MKKNNFIIFIILLTAPIDWFSPSGFILREAGAKPLIPILIIALAITILKNPGKFTKEIIKIDCSYIFIYMIALGFFAFQINQITIQDTSNYSKNNISQYINQSFMLLTSFLCIKSLNLIIRDITIDIPDLVLKTSILHIFVFLIDLILIENNNYSTPLSLFKNEFAHDRPSGFMSEPSYFGVFSAISASILLLHKKPKKILYTTVASILIAIPFLINSRTFIPVFIIIIISQIFLFRINNATSIKLKIIMPILFLFLFFTLFRNSTFSTSENLSSVMRLGSAALALNVIFDGYGLLGIGTGQFHYFYIEKYFPDFLFLSTEAVNQASPTNEFRASTYNLFIRVFLELGFLGFLGFLVVLFKLIKLGKLENNRHALIFLFGSFGFLLTQDTYCYPYLILGFSFLICRKGVYVTGESSPKKALSHQFPTHRM